MGLVIKFLVFANLALYAAYFIMNKLTDEKAYIDQLWKTSMLFVSVAVIFQNILIGFLVIFLTCAFKTKNLSPSKKIALFLGLIFILPIDSAVSLNIGLNFGSLNYYRVLVISLLLPIVLSSPKRERNKGGSGTDLLAFSFIGWIFIRNLFISDFTSMIRVNTWLIIDVLIPYMAIRYYSKDHYLMFVGLSFGLLVQAFISIFEGIFTWKIYESFRMITGYMDFTYSMYKTRGGFLRSEGVFGNPLVISLFANFAFLSMLVLYKNVEKSKKFYALVGLVICFLGTFFTGSRAGLIGLGIIYVVYMGLNWAVNKKEDPKNSIIVVSLSLAVIGFMLIQDSLKEVFGYRYSLVDVSWEVILSNFFTGSFEAIFDPRLEVLIQGEGIVDVVNSYVWFALYYGMVSVALLFMVALASLSGIYKKMRRAEANDLLAGFVFTSLLVLLFNLATTSPLGWTYQWLWVCIPISATIISASVTHRSV